MITDTTTVDHYLKPGLYSASPAMIREKRPQYKQFFHPKRVEWLCDRVQTKGNKDHHFNEILIHLGHPEMMRASYPTSKCKDNMRRWAVLIKAKKYIEDTKSITITRHQLREIRAKDAAIYRKNFHLLSKNEKIPPRSEEFSKDFRGKAQCQKDRDLAIIHSMASKLDSQGDLAAQLQQKNSELLEVNSEIQCLQSELAVQAELSAANMIQIHQLQEDLDKKTSELNERLLTQGQVATGSKCHKQTRTRRKGEKLLEEGRRVEPSDCIKKWIRKKRRAQTTVSYVDPTGEITLHPAKKLKNALMEAIKKLLNQRWWMRRKYTSSSNKSE